MTSDADLDAFRLPVELVLWRSWADANELNVLTYIDLILGRVDSAGWPVRDAAENHDREAT